MRTILFQGDSITDCGRDRKAAAGKKFALKQLFNKNAVMGNGYPLMVVTELEAENPGTYNFHNRSTDRGGSRELEPMATKKNIVVSLAWSAA